MFPLVQGNKISTNLIEQIKHNMMMVKLQDSEYITFIMVDGDELWKMNVCVDSLYSTWEKLSSR